MICIRFFKTRKEAEWARDLLQENGIESIVTEDKFNNVPIQEFGVTARFRLKIDRKDLARTARFLKGKMSKS